MEELIKQYFRDRPAISVFTFEREAGIPPKTLEHFLSGRRGIKASHLEKVINLIEKYSKGYFQK